jgi:hypothetical protein
MVEGKEEFYRKAEKEQLHYKKYPSLTRIAESTVERYLQSESTSPVKGLHCYE